jgi:SH3 domain protein
MLLVLLVCPVWATAETVYVTDVLRLGLHRAQDTSDRAFDNLASGTALEVLQTAPGGYARVRTGEGVEGWVKSAYLVSEKPAQARLAEIEAELDTLRARLVEAEAARVTAEEEASRLGRQAEVRVGSERAVREALARLTQENDDYAARLEAYRGSLPLTWVAAALLIALGTGFLSGVWWLDALIRKRHGGFRIY